MTQSVSSIVISFAQRSLNAASENPGTFTNTQSSNISAQTYAIRPAFDPKKAAMLAMFGQN
jgi:hypothetical protein